MRINKYIATSTGISRRAADGLIYLGKVTVNGLHASSGQDVSDADVIIVDSKLIDKASDQHITTIILNKPVGYVCSRDGQGSKTVYDLLPAELHSLKPVGRLDKDSSGLLVMTNDGKLAHEMTHPSFKKNKIYKIELNRQLNKADFTKITDTGVDIGDERLSKFELRPLIGNNSEELDSGKGWLVTMSEGRNRQIRRTFSALDYTVTRLHRTYLGQYALGSLESGKYTKA